MRRVRALLLLCVAFCALGACSIGAGPTAIDERVAVWRQAEADQEARQDTDMAREDEAQSREAAAVQAQRREKDAVLDAQNTARQNAKAALFPAMLGCLADNVRLLTAAHPAATHPEGQVADMVLLACRPAIAAVARTVELVQFSSAGLERDMAIWLRPQVVRAVRAERARLAGHPVLWMWDTGDEPR